MISTISNAMLVVSALVGIKGLLNGIFVVRATDQLRCLANQFALRTAGETDYPPIILLVPAIRESQVIAHTLRRLSRMNYPTSKYRILCITSEREYEQAFEPPSTLEVADATAQEINQALGTEMVLRLHYPFTTGIKSDQLNYALSQIPTVFPDMICSKTYIGVYDADSSPDVDSLRLLAVDAVLHDFPETYQQPTLYFKNYHTLPSSISGLLARAFALLQTAYAFYHEYWMWQAQTTSLVPRMKYCVGHGLFVRYQAILSLGMFPTPIEDTRLGHILSYMGREIRILPVFDCVEVTASIRSQMQQTSVWFVGVSLFLKDYKISRSIASISISSYRTWMLAAQRLARNFAWVTKGIILWAVILWAVYRGAPLLLLGPAIYVYLPVLALLAKVGPTPRAHVVAVNYAESTLAFVALPFQYLAMSLGALLGLFKRLRGLHDQALPKTERWEIGG